MRLASGRPATFERSHLFSDASPKYQDVVREAIQELRELSNLTFYQGSVGLLHGHV